MDTVIKFFNLLSKEHMCESTKVKIIFNPIRNFHSQSTAKDINFRREYSEQASNEHANQEELSFRGPSFPEEEDKTGM